MATYTSTQSGNFNSSSTWGGSGPPADGDEFIVNYGHIVTLNDDQRKTNGFGNSYVRGKLDITSGGQIRMNGVLYVDNSANYASFFAEGVNSGGFLKMGANTNMEFRGANADNHHLQFRNHSYITLEFEGGQKMRQTTLSAEKVIRNTTLDVTSSTGFAAGDWVTAYRTELSGQNQNYNRSDEGMIIHDISGNTIYFRHFVSPTATIESVRDDKIKVDNAKVFRVGDLVIFGTGSNRNVKEITSIGYNSNIITLNSNVSGTVTGETVYKTGLDKSHISGDKFEKVATVMTADASSSANTITVASTDGFAVGDEIGLPNTNLEYTSTWNFNQNFTIQSISGNNITLTSTLGTTTFQAGTFVCNLTRDCKFQGVDEDQRVFFYTIYWTSSNGFYRRFRLRNVQFKYLGGNTNSSVYRGVRIRGRFSYNLTSYGQYTSAIESCSFRLNSNGSDSYKEVVIGNHMYYIQVRNCITTQVVDGLYIADGYERGIFNNISYHNSYAGFQLNGMYNSRNQFAYNLSARADDYGILCYHLRNKDIALYMNKILCSEHRAVYHYYNNNDIVWNTCEFDGFREWAYAAAGGGNHSYFNCYTGNDWDVTGNSRVYSDGIDIQYDGNGIPQYGGSNSSLITSVCNNFEIDGLIQWGTGSLIMRKWDADDKAWRIFNDRDQTNLAGFWNLIYLPANTKLLIKGYVKKLGASAGAPYLEMRSYTGTYDLGNYTDYTTANGQFTHDDPITTVGGSDRHSAVSSFRKRDRFPTFTTTEYNSHTLTLDPLKRDALITFGISMYSPQNADPGWYEKPLEVYMNNRRIPYKAPLCGNIFNSFTTNDTVTMRTDFTERTTRLGGRF